MFPCNPNATVLGTAVCVSLPRTMYYWIGTSMVIGFRCVLLVATELQRAPEGYEDETGFRYGRRAGDFAKEWPPPEDGQ